MSSYKTFFKGKRILIAGLGPEFEAVGDILFLLKLGAHITIADLRSEKRVSYALTKLQGFDTITYVFGAMGRELVKEKDLVLKASDISYSIPCIEEALDRAIPVEISSTLCLKLAPPITLIGVLGACGKNVLASLIHKVLLTTFNDKDGQKVWHLYDKGHSPLLLLKNIKKGDIILVSICEEYIPTFVASRISPHVAVVTSFIQELSSVLEFQTYNNFIIANDGVVDSTRTPRTQAKILRTGLQLIPSEWTIPIRYQRENMALALRVAELFKVDYEGIREIFESFKNIKGHIEYIRKANGVEYYNDAASTNPHATMVALQAVTHEKNTVLIMGGVDRGNDLYELIKIIPKYASAVILIPGSGTSKLHATLLQLPIHCVYATSIEEAVLFSKEYVRRGGKVLFSPAFPSVSSIKGRSDTFLRAVKSLISTNNTDN